MPPQSADSPPARNLRSRAESRSEPKPKLYELRKTTMSLNGSYQIIMGLSTEPKVLRAALSEWFLCGLVAGLACVIFNDSIYSTMEMAIAFDHLGGVLFVAGLLMLRSMKV